MEAKKSKMASLKDKSTLFLEIGMVAALGLVIAAFQWSTTDQLTAENFEFTLNVDYDEELIPITRVEEKQPKPKIKFVKKLVIVEKGVDVEPVDIPTTEAVEGYVVDIIPIDEEIPIPDDSIFYIVEEKPLFPGGDDALIRTIAQNITYPEIAKENGIKGRVFVAFVVNQKGKVEQVKVVRGVDSSLDKEALRVISELPHWTPGKQRGKPVKVAFTVPINFQLN